MITGTPQLKIYKKILSRLYEISTLAKIVPQIKPSAHLRSAIVQIFHFCAIHQRILMKTVIINTLQLTYFILALEEHDISPIESQDRLLSSLVIYTSNYGSNYKKQIYEFERNLARIAQDTYLEHEMRISNSFPKFNLPGLRKAANGIRKLAATGDTTKK